MRYDRNVDQPRPTELELAALRSARGGAATIHNTPEHARFEKMRDKGWVKVATPIDGGVAWRLSGDGLRYAYGSGPGDAACG